MFDLRHLLLNTGHHNHVSTSTSIPSIDAGIVTFHCNTLACNIPKHQAYVSVQFKI